MTTPDLTRNQDLVLTALDGAARPMGAYEILDAVRDGGMKAPTQVYRALERLITLGLVHRIESQNAFIACTHACHHGTTAIAVCERCGAVAEFDAIECSTALNAWARQTAFTVQSTTLEVRGLCADCAQAA